MKNYDVHTHILSSEALPEKVLQRWKIPESLIVKIAAKIKKYDYAIDAIEWIYNLLAENDIDVNPILEHYCRTIEKNVEKLAYQVNDVGIDVACLLLLDLSPNWGISLQMT